MQNVEMRAAPAGPDPSSGASRPLAPSEPTTAPAAVTPPPATPRAVPPPRAVAPPLPEIGAFLGKEDTRLRDLLAFGLAVEAGRPVAGPDIAELRRKADAELEAQALRTLHNRVEAIRHEAMAEQLGRMARPLGFGGIVAANLLALAVAVACAVALWRLVPGLATGG